MYPLQGLTPHVLAASALENRADLRAFLVRELAAFARNITNEKNLKGVIENYMAAVYNEPRIIGVSFSGKIR